MARKNSLSRKKWTVPKHKVFAKRILATFADAGAWLLKFDFD